MSKEYCISIPGAPKGKGRPRFSRGGHAYTPESTRDYEDTVKAIWLNTLGKVTYTADIPLYCIITANFELPKSTSKKQRAEMLSGEKRPIKRPDLDNVAKLVLDSLNGVAFYDDAQIISLYVVKTYKEIASVDVCIGEIECGTQL